MQTVKMQTNDTVRRTDRVLGLGGVGLAAVALLSTTQRIEVSGDAEVVPAITGLVMVLAVLVLTVRHLRVHRGGEGKRWLIGGWVVLGANLVWSALQAMDTATFDDGIWHGLGEFASGPPILLTLVPLVLCSVGILSDSRRPRPGSPS